MKCIKFATFSILTTVFLVLSGCATSYKPYSYSGWCFASNGGYSETRTAPDSFTVAFNGNSSISFAKVKQYALRRASELTLQNGYKYFSIIHLEDKTTNRNYSNTTPVYTPSPYIPKRPSCYKEDLYIHPSYCGTSTQKGTIIEPNILIEIKCFNEKISSDAIDAAYFLLNN